MISRGNSKVSGATVGNDERGRVVVIAPLADSPADKAGIKPGDVILEVDGKSLDGMNSTDAVFLIRGPKGTKVKLTVLHENETEPVTIEIIRGIN